jgi:acyl-CoA reductase-like NAD-dependent aldehyde dehydrogenase
MDFLAEVITLEMGKPLGEARGEVAYAADLIRVELFDDALHLRTGFHVDEQSPIEHAKSV